MGKTRLECQANKTPPKLPSAALGTTTVEAPYNRLLTDYRGPFLLTLLGNRYILVVMDQFSKRGRNGEKRRVEAHVYKTHMASERAPVYCKLRTFRACSEFQTTTGCRNLTTI